MAAREEVICAALEARLLGHEKQNIQSNRTMKTISWVAAAVAAISLQGCLFIFIPGSVIGAVSDGITGAEGNHCVGANAKVGDRIALPGNGHGTVKSLSGTSMRCTDPSKPIRALLALDEVQPLRTQSTATPPVQTSIPDYALDDIPRR